VQFLFVLSDLGETWSRSGFSVGSVLGQRRTILCWVRFAMYDFGIHFHENQKTMICAPVGFRLGMLATGRGKGRWRIYSEAQAH
jgi:hypothetical protein